MGAREREVQRVAVAGRRFDAAENERLAALGELTAACVAVADMDIVDLAARTGVSVAGLLAVRTRLEGDRPRWPGDVH